MYDDVIHKGLRLKLVDEIRAKKIATEEVLVAMENVPRHYFMDKVFDKTAYEDRPFSIGCGQTISQPSTVAFQTSILDVKPYQKILEVGTGSGYQACVLAEMKATVFTIERHRNLFMATKPILQRMSRRVKPFFGDGYKGLPTYAPFDRILITCAAPFVPNELLSQLKIGGILVIPVDCEEIDPIYGTQKQIMKRIVKSSDDQFITEEFGTFQFVPMLKDREF